MLRIYILNSFKAAFGSEGLGASMPALGGAVPAKASRAPDEAPAHLSSARRWRVPWQPSSLDGGRERPQDDARRLPASLVAYLWPSHCQLTSTHDLPAVIRVATWRMRSLMPPCTSSSVENQLITLPFLPWNCSPA